MRLAVCIAAWSADPEATLSPVVERVTLPTVLAGLGYTVAATGTGDLASQLSAALAGVEATDTVLVHLSGALTGAGELEFGSRERVRLDVVTRALAAHPHAHALVFVEATYRGADDGEIALRQVEQVTSALSNGRHSTIVAVHPAQAEVARLAFTHAVLDAAREGSSEQGAGQVQDAYARARERESSSSASGFAFRRGATAFTLGRPVPPAPRTEPLLGAPTSARASSRSVPKPESSLPTTLPRVPPDAVGAAPSLGFLSSTQSSPVSPGVTPPAREMSSPLWVEVSEPVYEPPSIGHLEARMAEATAQGDYRLAVALARQKLAQLTTAEARVDELFEIGRMLVVKLRDLPEAVLTLEEARTIDPSRQDVLEALRRSYARLQRWTEAFAVTLALVKLVEDPHERAGLRVAAGLLACKHLADDEYALELLGQALEDDARNEDALAEITRIRRGRRELAELEQMLSLLANRLVEAGDAARAWDTCQKLAALRRDELGDAAGAVQALAIATRLPLTELDSRAVLAEQLIALDDTEGAVAELEAIVASQPGHVRAHARLFSVFHHEKRHDRAYLQALVLEELGDADATAREMLEAYRGDVGLRARSTLDDRAWERLRAPGSDDVIDAVLRAVVRPGIAMQVEDRGPPPPLDPARRQPETSTATIVRCFTWAARALGTPCPQLYVLDEVEGGIAAVAAPEPTTALGPAVVRGLSSKTLAFLAGRHLTYFRPEYRALVHFPTVEAAAFLFFAAVDLVAPGTFVPEDMLIRVDSAKQRLARHVRASELAAISEAVARLEARGTGLDFVAWIRSVELTAGRAGFLLAGDLQTALAQVRAEEHGLSGLGVDERRADLIAFCASRALADLRAAYVDTTPSSMRPPPSEATNSPRPLTNESAVVRMDDAALRQSGELVASNRLRTTPPSRASGS